MNVNTENALAVNRICSALADARFSMRTIGGILKANNVPVEDDSTPTAMLVDVAAQMGMRIRRRGRDGATLIERPTSVTPEAAQTFAARASAVLAGTENPFDVDFTPVIAPDEQQSEDEDFA